MTGFDIYVFILCFVVFAVFTLLFGYMIYTIMQLQIKLIKHGHLDEEITKEYEQEKNSKHALTWATRIFSWLLCLVFGVAFIFSLWLNVTEDRPANGIPSIKVVKSESMASKHKSNTYLVENDLNDQFQMFDIVVCQHMPEEDELKLYDIVVYKYDDIHIIHRIVGIEEPNEKHPNERHFLLKGDANKYNDEFPVLYSQMQGIYKGIRIPFVGSFVMFMQSPAGWLAILLVLFAMVGTPLVESKWKKARTARLIEIGVIVPKPEAEEMVKTESEMHVEELTQNAEQVELPEPLADETEAALEEVEATEE